MIYGLTETQSFLLKRKNEKSYMEAISNLAYSSRASYKSVLHRFEEFCVQNYNGRSADEIVAELKSIPSEVKDEAYFGVLQEYVNWLVKRNLSSRTIANNFKVVNQYFSYQGIRAHPSDIRQNVKRLKVIKEKLHPLMLEEIHQIFASSPNKRRTLYLLLIGTGMRIRECVSLRKKDFQMNSPKRIRIEIPAQYTKTKTAQTTFVSDSPGYDPAIAKINGMCQGMLWECMQELRALGAAGKLRLSQFEDSLLDTVKGSGLKEDVLTAAELSDREQPSMAQRNAATIADFEIRVRKISSGQRAKRIAELWDSGQDLKALADWLQGLLIKMKNGNMTIGAAARASSDIAVLHGESEEEPDYFAIYNSIKESMWERNQSGIVPRKKQWG